MKGKAIPLKEEEYEDGDISEYKQGRTFRRASSISIVKGFSSRFKGQYADILLGEGAKRSSVDITSSTTCPSGNKTTSPRKNSSSNPKPKNKSLKYYINRWIESYSKSRLATMIRTKIMRQAQEFVHISDNSPAAETVRKSGLKQRHLKKLKKRFEDIDVDDSGTIETGEFLDAIGEPKSAFTDSLFSFVDLDGSGAIDFDEFVQVCVTYCMYSKLELLRFWFSCFDEDKSGAIDEDEFVELCRTVNNESPMFPGNYSQAIECFDTNDDGLIDFQEFIELDRRFPLVLFPAFRLQDCMQRVTLGEKEWTKVREEKLLELSIEGHRKASSELLQIINIHGDNNKEKRKTKSTKSLESLGRMLTSSFFSRKTRNQVKPFG